VPSYQPWIAGENIRLGDGALRSVKASRNRTEVDTGDAPVRELRIGHTLPAGTRVKGVVLDGRRVHADVRTTNRGVEVTVTTGPGRHVLEVKR
jgi:hypothetical protein